MSEYNHTGQDAYPIYHYDENGNGIVESQPTSLDYSVLGDAFNDMGHQYDIDGDIAEIAIERLDQGNNDRYLKGKTLGGAKKIIKKHHPNISKFGTEIFKHEDEIFSIVDNVLSSLGRGGAGPIIGTHMRGGAMRKSLGTRKLGPRSQLERIKSKNPYAELNTPSSNAGAEYSYGSDRRIVDTPMLGGTNDNLQADISPYESYGGAKRILMNSEDLPPSIPLSGQEEESLRQGLMHELANSNDNWLKQNQKTIIPILEILAIVAGGYALSKSAGPISNWVILKTLENHKKSKAKKRDLLKSATKGGMHHYNLSLGELSDYGTDLVKKATSDLIDKSSSKENLIKKHSKAPSIKRLGGTKKHSIKRMPTRNSSKVNEKALWEKMFENKHSKFNRLGESKRNLAFGGRKIIPGSEPGYYESDAKPGFDIDSSGAYDVFTPAEDSTVLMHPGRLRQSAIRGGKLSRNPSKKRRHSVRF